MPPFSLTTPAKSLAFDTASLAGSQGCSLDLAAGRLRQLARELHDARVFVRSGCLLDVLLELRRERSPRFPPIAQYDDRSHDGAALLVGRGDRRRLYDGGMLDQRRLHLEGPDPVAGREDHVVETPLEPQVAVRVAAHVVSGVPAGVARMLRLAQITAKERR